MDIALIESYILLFFTASSMGWCMEVLCKLIQFKRFINRGFLIGPWCPIYGFGTVMITLLLSKFTEDPFAVFGLAILLCGTLEYLTSYIMEKAFHARWWDYSILFCHLTRHLLVVGAGHRACTDNIDIFTSCRRADVDELLQDIAVMRVYHVCELPVFRDEIIRIRAEHLASSAHWIIRHPRISGNESAYTSHRLSLIHI